jgi:hypothetical protein
MILENYPFSNFREEIFDYLLSLDDYPLEFVNKYGQTALTLSLTSNVVYDIWMGDHFAIELIRKGANIQGISSEGDTFLHCALDREFIKVAILLIERGIDVNIVNSEGYSPLEASLRWWSLDNQIELVSALLIYGADPFFVNQYGYSMFELAVLNENGSSMETLLYLYTFDEYSNKKIHLEVLLKLAQVESFVWDHIMDTFSVYEDSFDACVCRCVICFTDIEHFNIVIKKFGSLVRLVLFTTHTECGLRCKLNRTLSVKNLNVLLESDLKDDTVSFIQSVNSVHLFEKLMEDGNSHSYILERYCFLLSNGLRISELDLELVYQHYGYCELFRLLLHMDLDIVPNQLEKTLVASLYYQPTVDLEECLKNYTQYSLKGVERLQNYFAHPGLHELCCTVCPEKVKNLPQIPLLAEMARNVFRHFFIQTLGIKTAKEFYTFLNHLSISPVHKKIIALEVPLY